MDFAIILHTNDISKTELSYTLLEHVRGTSERLAWSLMHYHGQLKTLIFVRAIETVCAGELLIAEAPTGSL